MLNIAGGGGVTFLPAERGRGNERCRLTLQRDAGKRRDGRGMALRGIKIGGFARAPSALSAFFRYDKSGGNALGELTVAFDKNATGLEKVRHCDSA